MTATAVAMPAGRDTSILRSLARRVDPADPGAQNNLGVVYYRRGLFDDAIAAFSRALSLDERMRVARRNLEIAYGEAGLVERRVLELNAKCMQAPDDLSLLVECGVAEKTAGNLDQAEQKFRRALSQDPESSVLHFFLAEIFYNRGLGEEALRFVRRSIDLNPANPDAHYLAGFILGDLGRIDEAREANRHAVALNPALTRAQANLSLESGRLTEAAWPTEVPRDDTARSGNPHLTLALALRLKGYHAESLRECRVAIEAGEDPAAALEAIGGLHLLLSQPDQALEAYDHTLSVNDDNPRVWNQRGISLYLMGRADDAKDSFTRCVNSGVPSPAAQNNLGTILWDAGELREATNCFRRASRDGRALMAARLNLALALFRQGHFQLSLYAYRNILRDEPENAAAWNGAGRALLEFGHFDEARDACVRAIKADPQYAAAHRNLSLAFSGLGDAETAAECAEQAARLDPAELPQTMLLAIDSPELSRASSIENTIASGVPDYGLASDYISKGMNDIALVEIKRAMARGADEKSGMVLLGKCFAARGEYEVAERELVAVLGAVPTDDTAALELASVYRAMGRPGDALGRVVCLLKSNVYHFAALVVLGESLLDLRRTRDAARAFGRVLRFNPNHAVARKYSTLASAEGR